MKVVVNRLGKFSRSKQSRSNVPGAYASARQFFARLASEIFLSSLPTEFFTELLEALKGVEPHFLYLLNKVIQHEWNLV